MVKSVTSLTRSGLRDWYLQRLSAICIGAYFLLIFGYLFTHPSLSYPQWQQFMHCPWISIFSLLFVLSLVIHAWIGVWTISTDYLKCTFIRIVFQLFFIVLLIGSLFWGVRIFWGGQA